MLEEKQNKKETVLKGKVNPLAEQLTAQVKRALCL